MPLQDKIFPSRSSVLAKKEKRKAEKLAKQKASGVSRIVEEEPPKPPVDTPPPPEPYTPQTKPKKIRRKRGKSRFLKKFLKSVLVLGTLTGLAVAVGLEVNRKPAKKVATVVKEPTTSPPPLVTEPEKKKFFWER
uniref:Uncharacterized protein n=1 Tax=Picocystis salinarum TaxID=88271 RepID=A0A7S3UBW0_9CHLO|mmetsp:Transcript_7784/g.48284  ORF Transcript_7784/g.48284 Transcript_7784/m.48284 type:complete len:135 (+) Transcript_7784:160-564(+)